MIKKRIMTDDLDLSNKQGITSDQFYKKDETSVINDSSTKLSKPYKGDKRFFAVLSTSDKIINSRIYDKESWKKTVIDGSWHGPIYAKPMLRNHMLYSGTPFGRIKDSFFVDHNGIVVSNKDNRELPQKVLDYFKNLNLFEDGTGTVIVEFTSDEETAQRIIGGIDVTVSQSSFFGKATCTVCGMDYYGGECSHIAGRTYQIKKDDVTVDTPCYVMTSDFEPVELSIVNVPANNTSIIYVLDTENISSSDTQTCKSTVEDSTKPHKIDDNKNPCNDNDNEIKNTKTEDNQMVKKILKDALLEGIKKSLGTDSETLGNAFSEVFDLMSEDAHFEKIKALSDSIVETINAEKENVVKQTLDSQQEKSEITQEKTEPQNDAEKQSEKTIADNNEKTATFEAESTVVTKDNSSEIEEQKTKILGQGSANDYQDKSNSIISNLVTNMKF